MKNMGNKVKAKDLGRLRKPAEARLKKKLGEWAYSNIILIEELFEEFQSIRKEHDSEEYGEQDESEGSA